MIARLLLVAVMALLMGCDGLPGSFKRAAADVDATVPVEEAAGEGAAETAEDVAETAADDPAPEEAAEDTKPEAPQPEDPDSEPAADATPDATPEAKADPNAVARAKCVAGGDIFSKTKTGAFVCVSRTRDSGKSCTASGQCQGACLARSGTCSPVAPLVGCHDIITDNGGMATVCID